MKKLSSLGAFKVFREMRKVFAKRLPNLKQQMYGDFPFTLKKLTSEREEAAVSRFVGAYFALCVLNFSQGA